MEKTIILSLFGLSILFAIAILYQHCQQISLRKKQKRLEEYNLSREKFYASERQKVLIHYRKKLSKGDISKENALKDVAKLLAFNSGGKKEWLKEFKLFKQETKKSAS